MMFIAFLMTFLVGAFSGTSLFLYVIIHMDRREEKELAKIMHPSGHEEMPFNLLDYNKK